MTIIPAIDIIDGKCVRLTKGDFTQQKIYSDEPLEVAKQFADAGFSRLHIVDLDGARSGSVVNLKVLEAIASATKLVIDFGGGIKKITDLENVFNAGAAIAAIGSLAAQQQALLEEWLIEFGTGKFLIGADVLDEKIKISGWLKDTGINVFDFIGNMISIGVTTIFCTDISKDGMLSGPSVDLYKKILEHHPEINLIASGGVSSMNDILRLKEAGCSGAIVGKSIYEGKINLKELYLAGS